MEIAGLTVAQHADYLALVNAEIRPLAAATRAEEDFPLALGLGNLPWQLGAFDDGGGLAGGLAVQVRPLATSCGDIAAGFIGSVVTRPDCRGRGLSARLQAEALARLGAAGVPLAALWTDRPEIYAGRGFVPAGWEFHVGLGEVALPAAPTGAIVREWRPEDAPVVGALYDAHRLRTRRQPGDADRLYGMPGTRGLVAEVSGRVTAAVFCGRGADFPDYVAEWSGEPAHVLALLGAARDRGWAGAALVPAGAEGLAEHLLAMGAVPVALPAGCWCVTRPDLLTAQVLAAGGRIPACSADARAWLGGVGPDGAVEPGPLTLAVWGLDSA